RFVLAVILQNNDGRASSYNVIVGKDESIRIPHNACAGAEAMTTHNYQRRQNLLDKFTYYLCESTVEVHIISHQSGYSRFEAVRRAEFRSTWICLPNHRSGE